MVNFREMASDSQVARGSQDVFGVPRDTDPRPDARYSTIAINENRCSKNSFEGLAIHGFLTPRAVGFEHLVFFIRYQGNGQLMFIPEGLLFLHGIGRHAEDGRLAFGEGAGESAEIRRFHGAAGCVGPGIEEDYQLASCVVLQRYGLSAVAWQIERRRFHALQKHGGRGCLRFG